MQGLGDVFETVSEDRPWAPGSLEDCDMAIRKGTGDWASRPFTLTPTFRRVREEWGNRSFVAIVCGSYKGGPVILPDYRNF